MAAEGGAEIKGAYFVTEIDQNNLVMGTWSTGILGCINVGSLSLCCMATLCPCVSLAQIAHRLGMYKYWTVLTAFMVLFGVYVALALLESTVSKLFVFGMWAVTIVALLAISVIRKNVRERFQIPGSACEDVVCSCIFSCCVVGQLSLHVDSIDKDSCNFGPKDTLPGYNSQ
ncbi:hypothetical protein DYB31_011237 [Aphanomyces astaci]|uniref:Uncharacterized protein n=1 Tax=Aphanomyces astaci TaxID=112090 RepID=A0A397FGX0_APHAT|nr:hypothetical protein DYB31_011237 [Aphanomyces astaci]